MKGYVTVAVLLMGLTACGGGSSTSNNTPTPTTPSTPTQTNRPPAVNSVAFTPAFGVAQVSAFSFNASASDPDGDGVSYSWVVGGASFTGPSGLVTFNSGGIGTATVTVTDGKGGSTTESRSVVVGTMAGNWTGFLNGVPINMTLAQPAGGVITGTWAQAAGSGVLDPATVNKIDAGGNVTMRLKVSQGRYNDFTITGTLEQTGVRFVGVANGSGFSGSPVVLTK